MIRKNLRNFIIFILLLVTFISFFSVALACSEAESNGESDESPTDPNGPCQDDPVFLNSGVWDYTATDLYIEGRGVDVEITRYYSTQARSATHYGYCWNLNYNMKVRKKSESTIELWTGTNNRTEFTESSGVYYPPSDMGITDTFEMTVDGYLMKKEGGDEYYFDEYGNLMRIQDRHGNYILFEYEKTPISGQQGGLFDGPGNLIGYPTVPTAPSFWDSPRVAGFGSGMYSIPDSAQTPTYFDWPLPVNLFLATLFVTDTPPACSLAVADLDVVVDENGEYKLAIGEGEDQQLFEGGNTIGLEFAITKITDDRGRPIVFEYDSKGMLDKITYSQYEGDPDPEVWDYTYDASCNLIKVTTPPTKLSYTSTPVSIEYNYYYEYRLVREEKIYTVDGVMYGTPAVYDYILKKFDTGDGNIILENTYEGRYNPRVAAQKYRSGISGYEYGALETRHTSRDGVKTKYVFNEKKKIVSETICDLGWNPIADENDEPLYQTSYEYDAQGRKKFITHPSGMKEEMVYVADDDSHIKEITRVADARSTDPNITYAFTYEPRYNFTKTITTPDNKVITLTYDYEEAVPVSEYGNLVKIELPAVPTRYINGSNISVTENLSPVLEFSYYNDTLKAYHGKLEKQKLIDGVEIGYEYYDYADDTSDHTRSGLIKKVIVDPDNLVMDPTDPDIYVELDYNKYGDISSRTNSKSNATTYVYSILGDLLERTAPILSGNSNGYKSRYEYNKSSKLIEVKYQLGSTFSDVTAQRYSYGYDVYNRMTSVTNSLNQETKYTFTDADKFDTMKDPIAYYEGFNNYGCKYDVQRGLLWEVTDGNGKTTEYRYDQNGNIEYIKDAKAQWTQYIYDGFDRRIEIRYPDATTPDDLAPDWSDNPLEKSEYDSKDNIIRFINRDGTYIVYAYDDIDRMESAMYYDVSETLQKTYSYYYDRGGKLFDVEEIIGATTYTTKFRYDELGRFKAAVDVQNRQVGYEYDELSRATKLTYPDNSFITYHYDEMNRITDIKDDSASVIVHYDYDEQSRYEQVTYRGSTSMVYDYEDWDDAANDNFGDNLESITHNLTGRMLTYDYTYDAAGNRETMVIDSTDTYTYYYDQTYQLDKTKKNTVSSFYDYTYDDLGNRTYSKEDSFTLTYSTTGNYLNQYTSLQFGTNPLFTPTYDTNGNMTYDGHYSYIYDSDNSLIEVKAAAVSVATYAYDFAGRRTSKTVGSATTTYVYDGHHVAAEYENGVLARKYVYGPYIDEPVAMVKVAGGSETWYYYHHDSLGSIVALSNDSGNLVESYSYSPFGEVTTKDSLGLTISSSAVDNPYMFTARRLDAESGLYYYRARMYSAQLGRFLQIDPLGYYDSMNLYQYCLNSPVNYIDPWGEELKQKGKTCPNSWPKPPRGKGKKWKWNSDGYYEDKRRNRWVWHRPDDGHECPHWDGRNKDGTKTDKIFPFNNWYDGMLNAAANAASKNIPDDETLATAQKTALGVAAVAAGGAAGVAALGALGALIAAGGAAGFAF